MSKGKFIYKDTDLGLKAFEKELKRFDRTEATVGVHDDAGRHPEADMAIAELAAIHEFGLGVPERSWLRATFDKNQSKLRSDMEKLVKKTIASDGKFTAFEAVGSIGEIFRMMIDQRIRSRIPPPIKEETKKGRKARGHSPATPPLIASRSFLNSIESKVKD